MHRGSVIAVGVRGLVVALSIEHDRIGRRIGGDISGVAARGCQPGRADRQGGQRRHRRASPRERRPPRARGCDAHSDRGVCRAHGRRIVHPWPSARVWRSPASTFPSNRHCSPRPIGSGLSCNAVGRFRQLRTVSPSIRQPEPKVAALTANSSFERVYRANVGAVSGFFARRCSDPQLVADLTSETFVRAIASYRRFDPGRGTARAWLIGIARNVFRRHVSSVAEDREVIQRLGTQVVLGEDDVEDLAARIDAQSAGRALLARTADFPELERVAGAR